MIDYSKYNLAEMEAIVTVLDDLTDEMSVQEFKHDYELALAEFLRASDRAKALIDQLARDHAAAEAEKVDRIKQVCVAGAPPADESAPDMFGWVGNALDGLEVKLSD